MNPAFVKVATPEFLTKIMQGMGMGDSQPEPVHIPRKPDFNPTGLQDIGAGAGLGGITMGAGAAVPGVMAMFKNNRLSKVPGEIQSTKDGTRMAISEMMNGPGDLKTKTLMLKSMLDGSKESLTGLRAESKGLRTAIPSLLKKRNLLMKFGIPLGMGAGALAGLGYYNNRPAV